MFYLGSPIPLAVLFAMISLTVPSKAYAYLDPGSGSFFLQMLIASLLATSFVIKTWWRNIKTTFTAFYAKYKKGEGNVR